MIPLRDDIPSKTTPFVNYALILANAAVFYHELTLGRKLEPFLFQYGLVPAALQTPALSDLKPFFTSMFLHGGWLHVVANLWSLWIFGDNVEDRMGHFKYLLFYLLCGLAAGAAQVWASWGSSLPTIGASGAIAGVMGAYLLLFPHARVVTLIPIFFFFRIVEIPATLFLGLWIFTQFHSGMGALANAGTRGGVAWWAHIGGFLSGIVLLGVFALKRRR